ncbi:MAG: hypothetical protein KKH01_01035 [Firmicutes bacterium]|nr:hypothetical protein [Bacillota bacterium]
MKKSIVSIETIDKQTVNFKLRRLKSIYINKIVIRISYWSWIKTGQFENKNYELTPESLRYLIDKINGSKKKFKLSTLSSEAFLKSFPTSKEYMKYLKEIDNLPILD